MGLSSEGDQNVQQRYQDLCADLNMDTNASEEAWQAYQRISMNYTLEGESLHWLACALYVECRKGHVPTVGQGSVIEGNCVSLTRLLRSCKLSLVQFFNKMKKWADMASLSQEMRKRVNRLESNFNVSTVIFKKFEPIFRDVFKNPAADPPRRPRSRRQRCPPCTSSDVFNFTWALFVYVKGHFPNISDDLVNSYHLLLCCVDLVYSNAILADRRDLLNPHFQGLPCNFNEGDYRPSTEPPCIIQDLCNAHDGLPVEAKVIKEHYWKPPIRKLIEKKTLKGRLDTLSGLLDTSNFEANVRSLNNAYEEYVLNTGDFDERIFLGETAYEEIGIPRYSCQYASETMQRNLQQRTLQQHIAEINTLAPSTPLSGRNYLKDRDALNVTPVSTATQGVSKLQALLAGRKNLPGEALLRIFSECSQNPHESIELRVKEMGEIFCTSYAQPSEDHPGSHVDFAKKRLQLGETLYYKALENIMLNEKKKVKPNSDLTHHLLHPIFQRSLFACCLEIVIFSYNSQRTFPWILEIFDLLPYHFYKVIEILIRAEEGLSREVVKHLNHIEEQILESLAWKYDSPLWEAIKASEQPVPSCEDAFLPSQMESAVPNGQESTASQTTMTSPVAHPAVRRISSFDREQGRRELPPSPLLDDRFQSPAAGSVSSSAKRRLFMSTTTAADNTVNVITQASAVDSSTGQSSVNGVSRTVSITLQPLTSDNGITYIPISACNLPEVVTVTPATPCKSANISPESATSATNKDAKLTNKPKRSGSLGLFFRKVYHLAGVRLQDLCNRLQLDDDLRRKIWTCFEYSIVHHTEMMCDRHLDQILMCAVYVICKVTRKDKNFQEVMRCYRFQPQCSSHIYRSVLLTSKRRRNSGSSDNSKNGSGSSSPVPEKEDKEAKRSEQLSTIRSSSTLPVPQPNSQPPTPTRLAGTSAHFEFEDRGDIIMFYNTIFVKKVQKFALKFSVNVVPTESPILSPLPRLNSNTMSPWRRVSSKHSLYISPLKNNVTFPPSPSRPLSYNFSRSPAKDLRAINNMLRLGERKVTKKIFTDEGDNEPPEKRFCPDLTYRKVQHVLNERQRANSSPPE